MSNADPIIICRCEEITEEKIRRAIEGGSDTIDAVKKETRAGMGPCQGRICRRQVIRLICEQTGMSPDQIPPASIRPPYTAIPLGVIAQEVETIESMDEALERGSQA
ncbi:MAG: (2Fe-2S)-binding protein [Actinobacteria bacterium]|nr:(2Fe-2S)-binding protein [Actinomycetota bacterium]